MTGDCHIYLDESGDLGWKFDQPYRRGGSSRFLTIGAVVAPQGTSKRVSRLIRSLYKSRKWAPGREKKWADMTASARSDFANRAVALAGRGFSITFQTISVRKERVQQRIRADGNKLYNWMIKDLLLPVMAQFDQVFFVPDERSVKVKSGSSLHDYLQSELWFTQGVATKLFTLPSESSATPQLQFADMLAGAVQSHFEDADSDAFNILRSSISARRMFF